MKEGLLELFEKLKEDFLGLSLEEFAAKVELEGRRFDVWEAMNGTLINQDWTPMQDAKNAAARKDFPISLREEKFEDLKYVIGNIISKIKSGSTEFQKKRIREEIINSISDPKIKQICIEINAAPDSSVISLMENIGQCLKWILVFRAIEKKIEIRDQDEFKSILNKAISEHFYTDNAVKRFLNDFRDNFIKASFDMGRHSSSYIPDLVLINPALASLEHILKITFMEKSGN